MRVIRHHAPREQPVALSIEMPNDVRHNFCDSPVAPIASAQPVVQPRLAFSQDGPRFPKTRYPQSDPSPPSRPLQETRVPCQAGRATRAEANRPAGRSQSKPDNRPPSAVNIPVIESKGSSRPNLYHHFAAADSRQPIFPPRRRNEGGGRGATRANARASDDFGRGGGLTWVGGDGIKAGRSGRGMLAVLP
jgi:hypothetical protein